MGKAYIGSLIERLKCKSGTPEEFEMFVDRLVSQKMEA
jgi:hypothetical protein